MGCDYGGFSPHTDPELFQKYPYHLHSGDVIFHNYWGPCVVNSMCETVGDNWAAYATDLSGEMRYFTLEEAHQPKGKLIKLLKEYGDL